MEPDFHDLALAKFLQGFPELGNLIVAFKDVSDDLQEDVDLQVGVFILKSGMDIFYVPVVSKADNVYPIDSVFFANNKKFFPLTKKTMSLVLNAGQMQQGSGMKLPSNVVTNPDLTELINPPRTGKYVAASSSKLGDFMAGMPNYLKTFTFEKLAEEQTVYKSLNNLFAIQDIFAALKATPGGMAAVTNQVPISIVTGVSPEMPAEQVRDIVNDGYTIVGSQPHKRFAVSAQTYEDNMFTNVVEMDGNTDYELMLEHGHSREAFIPKIMSAGHVCMHPRKTVALFTNGDFAIAESFVAKGTKLNRTDVVDAIFKVSPPVLPRDVAVNDTFAIIDVNTNLLGIFEARKVMLSHLGVEIDANVLAGFSNGTNSGRVRLCAYRNYGGAPSCEGHTVYMNYSTLVLKLGSNISMSLERSANSASRKHEIAQAGLLGDQMRLAYDGVEFSVNGKVIGEEKRAMSVLVVDEGIDPYLAKDFVKQAKEKKSTLIYMSKKASAGFRAGEIPQFGDQPPKVEQVGLNGSFIPNVQKSLMVSDAQTTEATIISELLQCPDLFELIEEYMPDIEEAIDKLGRVLFLSRVHITKLSKDNDVDAIFSFLANLKNVYKMLGDNVIKLRELLALKPNQE